MQAFVPDDQILKSLEPRVQWHGARCWESMQRANSDEKFWHKNWWYSQMLKLCTKDHGFKLQMFRFVDVFASLKDFKDISQHVNEYFQNPQGELPKLLKLGSALGHLSPRLMSKAVSAQMQNMSKIFISGQEPEQIAKVVHALWKQGVLSTVDILDEATLSETKARANKEAYISLMQVLSKSAKTWRPSPQANTSMEPVLEVSVKLSALYSHISEAAFDHSVQTLKERLRPILQQAMHLGVGVNIDAERFFHQKITLQVFSQIVQEPEFKTYPHWGVVLQAYLKKSLSDLKELMHLAQQRGVPFKLRLVKGAYWDYESMWAEQQNWPSPVFLQKSQTDHNFERCVALALSGKGLMRVAVASHNVRSVAVAQAAAEFYNSKNHLEFQVLFGMAQSLKKCLVGQGYPVREYVTMGEAIPGMAYLVRRLLENTSQMGFVQARFEGKKDLQQLLAPPLKPSLAQVSVPPVKTYTPSRFTNTPLIDWGVAEDRARMQKALAGFEKGLFYGLKALEPVKAPHLDPAQEVYTRLNPSRSSEVLGHVEFGGVQEAQATLDKVRGFRSEWYGLGFVHRAKLLRRLGDLLLEHRFELMALQVLEVGKGWHNADAEVCEAVDFCYYYAQQAEALHKPGELVKVPGEENVLVYRPHGVGVVVAPWNFPLAILTGMLGASLVTGNVVVAKPAEQSSITAFYLRKYLYEAGFPQEAAQFVWGRGEVVGAHLVSHADVISFTGSREVGVNIMKRAITSTPPKALVVEMGGKNAIIVDSDADLDEALKGVLYSAFGFQGQKCSACSRLILHKAVYEVFVKRLLEALESFVQGPSVDPAFHMGPLIDRQAFLGVRDFLQQCQEPLLWQGAWVEGGYFVPPTVFGPVDPGSELAQKELFAPVLAVIKVEDMDEAFKVFHQSEYGLTGGLYSRSPHNIKRARKELVVGNLYINREITGAIVGRHPFGGFGMSGLGHKAGAPHTLLDYVRAQTLTENKVRQGFF